MLSAEDKLTIKVGSAMLEILSGGDIAVKGAKVSLNALRVHAHLRALHGDVTPARASRASPSRP